MKGKYSEEFMDNLVKYITPERSEEMTNYFTLLVIEILLILSVLKE
jgi:uncharacterized membrane protein required for colicin V production